MQPKKKSTKQPKEEPEWYDDVDQICTSIIKFVTFFVPISFVFYSLAVLLNHFGYMTPLIDKLQPRAYSPITVFSALEPNPIPSIPGSASEPSSWKLSITITRVHASLKLSHEFVGGHIRVVADQGNTIEGLAFRFGAWEKHQNICDPSTTMFSTNIPKERRFIQVMNFDSSLYFEPLIGVRMLNPRPGSYMEEKNADGLVFSCPHYMTNNTILSGRSRRCTIAGTFECKDKTKHLCSK